MPSEPNPEHSIYRFIIGPRQENDPRSAGYLTDAHALGLMAITALHCFDLYFVEGQLSSPELERLAHELLADPVAQIAQWETISASTIHSSSNGIIEVALRPGVTDPVAEQLVRGAHELGISNVARASTGLRFVVEIGGPGTQAAPEPSSLLHLLARRLLANAVIQRYALGEIEPIFPRPAEASGQVDILPVRYQDDTGLLALSRERRAALDLAEMQAIQNYYRDEGRDPTDIEFETLAQTWSEHCGHKTFKARIEIRDMRVENREKSPHSPLDVPRSTPNVPPAMPLAPPPSALASPSTPYPLPSTLDSLFKTYIRSATEQIAAPWVRSAFIDNAGIIDFDDTYEVSFKVETHNHPSAIEPFGGANTGVGGVIRDVIGVSAKPIANTDVLCFGPQDLPVDALPEGVLHPRRIQSGVVAGVQDYGNKIGIPTVNGAILYDPGYTANPLVFCGCVGIAPKGSHPARSAARRPGHRAWRADRPRRPARGNLLLDDDGRSDRRGLGCLGADRRPDHREGVDRGGSAGARSTSCTTPSPTAGRAGCLRRWARWRARVGADVELKDVRLKYPGLAPWEIWLSEAQERMVLAVPAAAVPAASSDLRHLRSRPHRYRRIHRLRPAGRALRRAGCARLRQRFLARRYSTEAA